MQSPKSLALVDKRTLPIVSNLNFLSKFNIIIEECLFCNLAQILVAVRAIQPEVHQIFEFNI